MRSARRDYTLVIPMNLATQSKGIWPGIPIERGHPVGAKRRWGVLIVTDSLGFVKFLFLSH